MANTISGNAPHRENRAAVPRQHRRIRQTKSGRREDGIALGNSISGTKGSNRCSLRVHARRKARDEDRDPGSPEAVCPVQALVLGMGPRAVSLFRVRCAAAPGAPADPRGHPRHDSLACAGEAPTGRPRPPPGVEYDANRAVDRAAPQLALASSSPTPPARHSPARGRQELRGQGVERPGNLRSSTRASQGLSPPARDAVRRVGIPLPARHRLLGRLAGAVLALGANHGGGRRGTGAESRSLDGALSSAAMDAGVSSRLPNGARWGRFAGRIRQAGHAGSGRRGSGGPRWAQMVTAAVLDLVTFVLAALPIAAGLVLVLFSFKERSRLSAAPVKTGDRRAPALPNSTPPDRM